ncbi:M48 family metalloprotease [Streptomyces goshikiensis]|uniref:M48 family metallopeptidase n=1 Tax=Streptomyces goshikiensis TaxID=1942 RepID=UPI003793A0B7
MITGTGTPVSDSAEASLSVGTRIRLALAAFLLLGFYISVAVSLLLWAALVVLCFDTTTFDSATVFPGTVFLFVAGTTPLAYVVAKATHRSLFFVEEETAPSTDPADHQVPALRGLVDEVARQLGITEPVTIRLTGEATAQMTDEDAGYLGLSPGHSVLSVGLPLLAALSRDQMRAVVTHEMAHMALRHHRARACTVRLETSLAAANRSLDELTHANRFVAMYTGYPRMLIGVHRWLFRLVVQSLRRRQEREADAAAARWCGAATVADALIKAALAESLWPDFQKLFLKQGLPGFLPVDPFRGFAHTLSDPSVRSALRSLRTVLLSAPAAITGLGSPHPHLADRCERLTRGKRLSMKPLFQPDGTFLPSLLPQETAWLLPDLQYDTATVLPWDEWTSRRRDARLVPPLLSAARVHIQPGRTATLYEVLRILDAGQRMALARDLEKRLPAPDGEAGAPLDVLARAILALVRTRLGDRPAPRTLLEQLVRNAVLDTEQVSRLSLHLAALGVDEHAPGEEDGHTETDAGWEPAPQIHRISRRQLSQEQQERVKTIGSATIALLLGGLVIGGLLWAGKGEPESPELPQGGVQGVPSSSPTASLGMVRPLFPPESFVPEWLKTLQPSLRSQPPFARQNPGHPKP